MRCIRRSNGAQRVSNTDVQLSFIPVVDRSAWERQADQIAQALQGAMNHSIHQSQRYLNQQFFSSARDIGALTSQELEQGIERVDMHHLQNRLRNTTRNATEEGMQQAGRSAAVRKLGKAIGKQAKTAITGAALGAVGGIMAGNSLYDETIEKTKEKLENYQEWKLTKDTYKIDQKSFSAVKATLDSNNLEASDLQGLIEGFGDAQNDFKDSTLKNYQGNAFEMLMHFLADTKNMPTEKRNALWQGIGLAADRKVADMLQQNVSTSGGGIDEFIKNAGIKDIDQLIKNDRETAAAAAALKQVKLQKLQGLDLSHASHAIQTLAQVDASESGRYAKNLSGIDGLLKSKLTAQKAGALGDELTTIAGTTGSEVAEAYQRSSGFWETTKNVGEVLIHGGDSVLGSIADNLTGIKDNTEKIKEHSEMTALHTEGARNDRLHQDN